MPPNPIGAPIVGGTSVQVAVRIRPQNAREREGNAAICLTVTPDEPQVTIGGNKAFTYDYVFDQNTQQQVIYNNCVQPLVDGTFEGFNATVLAYGQTGSGKTFTMGTSFDGSQQIDSQSIGIIPRAAKHLFSNIAERKKVAKAAGQVEPSFEVHVQFIELYNEEIIDLLATDRQNTGQIKIHEDTERSEICLRGVTVQPANSPEDILAILRAGALNRTTGATNMNQQSSRSHAIFTVTLKQTRVVPVEKEDANEKSEDAPESNNEGAAPLTELEVLHAKFHFVDLAGSERLKRTGATGHRAREGISINGGLLALGNVISALGGANGRSTFVPYRVSKLTRLLQDSLGGNSRTLMIACASPSDLDFVETLNSLNYANRAKNIKNRVVANQNKSSKMIAELRARIAELELELNEYKQGKRLVGSDGVEQINDQYAENVQLKMDNDHLCNRAKALGETIEILQARIVELQSKLEMSKLRGGGGRDGEEETENEHQFGSMIQSYLCEIEKMKTQLIELQSTNEQLRKQNSRLRTHLEQAGLSGSSANSPFAPNSQQHLMSQSNTFMVLKSARNNIARNKRKLATKVSFDPNGQEAIQEEGERLSDEEEEREEMDMDQEVEDEMESDNDENEGSECDRICGDLAQLQEDINIKERLVAELEQSERRLEQLRRDYERKLGELSERITFTEAERDRILNQMAAKKQTKQQQEEINKVREKYEKSLADMRLEHRRLELAERENKRMQAQQSRQQNEVNRFKQELEQMKRHKVDLMKKLKEENKRIRELELAGVKKQATYEKMNRQHLNRIQKLELVAAQKTESLRRKQEEMERMKEREKTLQKRRQTIYEQKNQQKPQSSAQKQQTAVPVANNLNSTFTVESPKFGATGQQLDLNPALAADANEIFQTPPHPSVVNRRRSLRATPAHTKRQWATMERAISLLINKRQAITKMEQGMNRQMRERRELQEELARLDATLAVTSVSTDRAVIIEQQQSVQEKLNYVQEEIVKIQNGIVELDMDQQADEDNEDSPEDDSKSSTENIESLAFCFARQFAIPPEAQYIVRNLLQLAIDKGAEAAKVQSEYNEMNLLLGINQGGEEDERRQITAPLGTVQPPSAKPSEEGLLDTTFMLAPPLQGYSQWSQSHATLPSMALTSPQPSSTMKHRRRTGAARDFLNPPPCEDQETVAIQPHQTSPSENKENAKNKDTRLEAISEMSNSDVTGPPAVSSQPSSARRIPSPDETQVMKHSSTTAMSTSEEHSQIETTRSTERPAADSKKCAIELRTMSAKEQQKYSSKHLSKLRVATGHSRGIHAIHATERQFITGSKDRSALVWDLETASHVNTLANHENNVEFVHLMPDQQYALTSSLNLVKVWDLRSGDCVFHLMSSGMVEDGSNAPTKRTDFVHPTEALVHWATVSKCNRFLFTSCRNAIRVWNLETFQYIGVLGDAIGATTQSEVNIIAVSDVSSASRSLSTMQVGMATRIDNKMTLYPGVRISNGAKATIDCGQRIHLAPAHAEQIDAMLIHGNSLFSGSKDQSLMRFSLVDFKRDHVQQDAHSKPITSLCLVDRQSEEGPLLASACRGGTVKLWDVSSSNKIHLMDAMNGAHKRSILAMAANSQLLFTASNDNTATIWKII